MSDIITIYCLYRLIDQLSALFPADSPHRKELERNINAMLDDLEGDAPAPIPIVGETTD